MSSPVPEGPMHEFSVRFHVWTAESATLACSAIRLRSPDRRRVPVRTDVTDWVPVLEGACVAHLDQLKRVELDFEDVSFLDRVAVTAVRELVAKGVTILRPTPLVRHLLRTRDRL